MTHYYFCTYFDQHYSDKGLALYESIVKHVPSFTLYILCLDDEVHKIFLKLNLSSVVLIKLVELETRNPAVYRIRKNRSLIEYYFTCTPVFIRDTMAIHAEIDILTYIDADMFLFSSIDAVYDEMGSNSILIVEHRFSPGLQERLIYGRFNVGYLSFRNNEVGKRCLDDWSRDCIDWCYDLVDGDKFADQKYLNKWVNIYPGLKISDNYGLNLAPWNISQYHIQISANKVFLVDKFPLLIYHFHEVREEFSHTFLKCFDNYLRNYSRVIECDIASVHKIYFQYLSCLLDCRRIIIHVSGKEKSFYNIRGHVNNLDKQSIVRNIKKTAKKIRLEHCSSDIFFIVDLWLFKVEISYLINYLIHFCTFLLGCINYIRMWMKNLLINK